MIAERKRPGPPSPTFAGSLSRFVHDVLDPSSHLQPFPPMPDAKGPTIDSMYILVESNEVQDRCHCELERLFGQDEISARPKRAHRQARQETPPAPPQQPHMHVVHGACSSALHTSCQNVTRPNFPSQQHLQQQLQRTHTHLCCCLFRLVVASSWSIILGFSTDEPMGPSLFSASIGLKESPLAAFPPHLHPHSHLYESLFGGTHAKVPHLYTQRVPTRDTQTDVAFVSSRSRLPSLTALGDSRGAASFLAEFPIVPTGQGQADLDQRGHSIKPNSKVRRLQADRNPRDRATRLLASRFSPFF